MDFSGVTAKPIAAVNKKMDELKDKAGGASVSIEDMSKKLGKAGEEMQSVGKSMSKKLTAPIVGFGAASVKTVSSFDDSMADMAKRMQGLTDNEFKELREEAQRLGSTTAFSAKENWSVVEESAA